MLYRVYRPLYIILRFAEMFISSGSRLINAVLFCGSTHQTLSSRAFIDGQTNEAWSRRRYYIDLIFWFQPSHCAGAWAKEVTDARKTLLRAKAEPHKE